MLNMTKKKETVSNFPVNYLKHIFLVYNQEACVCTYSNEPSHEFFYCSSSRTNPKLQTGNVILYKFSDAKENMLVSTGS